MGTNRVFRCRKHRSPLVYRAVSGVVVLRKTTVRGAVVTTRTAYLRRLRANARHRKRYGFMYRIRRSCGVVLVRKAFIISRLENLLLVAINPHQPCNLFYY